MPASVRYLTPQALTAALVLGFALARPAGAQTYLNAQMPWHPVKLDAQGKLLAWYKPENNLGYDHFLRLAWDFLEHRVPIDKATGVRVYLTASIFDGETLQGINWQHNPPSLYAHMMDMLAGWYAYSGDSEAIRVLREMLDYQIAHGTAPADWAWPGVPFPTACLHDKEYGRCLQDTRRDFFGGIETDKVGELGLAYVLFWELTGERRFLDAGLQCASQLARYVRPGDAAHTPWPFRIDARTGEVIGNAEFGGMVVAPVRLFDELLRLGQGDAAAFRKARDMAWNWILRQQLNKRSAAWDKWSGYYEDQPNDPINVNDMNSMMTAYYILSQEDPAAVDLDWINHVGHLIDRSRVLLGRGPYFGAWAIDEQLRPDGAGVGTPGLQPGTVMLGTDTRGCCSRAGLSCRTSQWAAVNAMFYERTHDGQAREDAFRSLNYATYFALPDGRIACCGVPFPDPFWFEDGYADAGRSFMWAMGAIPDVAPIGQDHILRSSSMVRKVGYTARSVEYETFDPAGTQALRLNFRPGAVTAGGKPLGMRQSLNQDGYSVRPLAGGDFEVRVRYSGANAVSIKGGLGTAPARPEK